MYIKHDIIEEFDRYDYIEKDPIDEEIKEHIKIINQSPNLKTKFSCYSHNYNNHPYIAFVVNENGWENLWKDILPAMCVEYEISISILHIHSHMICLYGKYSTREKFWETLLHLKNC